MGRKTLLVSLLTALALLWPYSAALAHSVFIFAWVDGDRICTESYFSKKSKVRGGTVRMLDERGRELQSGSTDENGMYCFNSPAELTGLVLVIEAGEGHRGEFRLSAADLKDGGLATAPKASAELPAPAQPEPGLARLEGAADEAALRRIIREELQGQLSPIKKALAENSNDQTPGWREVIGGLGWLAGLAGLALWRASRGKQTQT